MSSPNPSYITIPTQKVIWRVVAGMYVYGKGAVVSSPTGAAFATTDVGDTFTHPAHMQTAANMLPDNAEVMIISLTTTTGPSLYTNYYVINSTTTTFQLSATVGGAPITLTNDGTAFLKWIQRVVSVITNTSITLDLPTGTNTASSEGASFRNLNTPKAIIRGWTVSG